MGIFFHWGSWGGVGGEGGGAGEYVVFEMLLPEVFVAN